MKYKDIYELACGRLYFRTNVTGVKQLFHRKKLDVEGKKHLFSILKHSIPKFEPTKITIMQNLEVFGLKDGFFLSTLFDNF